jgi:hypothetical protein
MSKGQNVFQTHRREDVSLAGQVRAVVSPSDLLEARASIQRSRRQRHGNNSRTTFCPGCGGPKSLRAKRCMDCRVEAMSAAQRQAKAAGRRTTAHRADQLLPRVVEDRSSGRQGMVGQRHEQPELPVHGPVARVRQRPTEWQPTSEEQAAVDSLRAWRDPVL